MASASSPTSASLPAATPRYILRGHKSPIHALDIFSHNTYLVSADSDGWIVIWKLVTKRPIAVWKGHEGAVLEVKGFIWNEETLSTLEIFAHGRDHKLRVWRIKSTDEDIMEKRLPVDIEEPSTRSTFAVQPWLVHSLPVNALNFCAFSLCFLAPKFWEKDIARAASDESAQSLEHTEFPSLNSIDDCRQLLFAVPNALNSGAIDLFCLPSEKRVTTIPADSSIQTGMVMAVKIFFDKIDKDILYAVSGYEDGHVMVHCSEFRSRDSSSSKSPLQWRKLYISRPHSQPVLSLDVLCPQNEEQASQPLFFLSSSADAMIVKHPIPRPNKKKGPSVLETNPLKVVNTKHAGQQGLQIRSDGKLFATAGWDARVRVYSLKTMRELAVLKWHKEGCYCIAFAEIFAAHTEISPSQGLPPQPQETAQTNHNELIPTELSPLKRGPLTEVRQQRDTKSQSTHWLAAGSKDGKVSLWDIY